MTIGHEVEVELKFDVLTEGAADRYLVAPELGSLKALAAVRNVVMEDRYVDTADWALAGAGYAARLRQTAHGTLIGLKRRGGAASGLHRREELEGPAELAAPPTGWPESAARSVVMKLCGDAPLTEVATLRQTRRTRRFGTAETRVELSLDEVEVFAGGRPVDRFTELEAELKGGQEEALDELGRLFEQDTNLRAQPSSKLERASRAIRSALPTLPTEVQARWREAPVELRPARGRATADEPADSAPAEAGPGRHHGRVEIASARPRSAGEDEPVPRPAGPRPDGPRAIGLLPEDGMPEAARKVLAHHFARLRAREKGVRGGANTEDLHDMRVAVRRMRASWRVFDEAFKGNRTKKLRRRLRVLSDRIGAVRDLDVLIECLEEYRAGLDAEDRAGLDPLLSLWHKQRASDMKLLMDELDAERYAGFLAGMQEFLEAGANEAATMTSPNLPHRVRDRAPSLLWTAYEAVRAYDMVLPWADVETLHRVRIATKWLRYDLEFFGETLGHDAPRLMGRVVALQDFLGSLHDADVAARLARDVLVARAGELSRVETETIGAFLHSRERVVARRRRALGPVWRAVTGAPFRRALGRATAAL